MAATQSKIKISETENFVDMQTKFEAYTGMFSLFNFAFLIILTVFMYVIKLF